MQYYFPYTDADGYVHSIDMVYCEYLSFYTPDCLLGKFQEFKNAHPDLEYLEMLSRPFHSKYHYYRDAVRFDGVFIEFGRYNNYDKVSRSFDLLNMFQVRFNPNKYMHLNWFQELLLLLLDCGSSGHLRKYDYALDLPVPLDAVQLFDCRREKGLYKGTRYFGQAGRHGYIKVYDKFKDLFSKGILIDAPLTRVEQTFLGNQDVHLENVYVLDRLICDDFEELKDTDRAIVEMYAMLRANGLKYDLNLGRGKTLKLQRYLSGGYKMVDYSNILDLLLKNIRSVLKVDTLVKDSDGFIVCDSDDDLPFD